MKNKLLFYSIGLCIGLYIAAAMFPSRLADINVAIPDGYILSIFGSKLYNVPMYLSIMMDLVSDTDLDKATRLFFLKSIAPCIVTIILLAVVMFWEYINPKPNTHGTAEWADTNYLEQLFLFKDSPTSPVIGVSEPVWLTPIYKWLCNFEEYRAIGEKPPKEKIERLHKFVTLMRQLGIRRLLRGKTDTHYVGIAPTGAGKGIAWIIATLLGAWRESCLVTDLKGELWDLTSKYRKEKLGQLVMKFNPTALDHQNVRWNPISEIRWGTEHEMKDVSNLAEVLVPKGKGDPFWVNSAKRLLSAVIIYLKYHDMKHPRPVEKEGDSPYHETSLKDVLTFFSGMVVEDPNNINESDILNYLKESINVLSDCKQISASYITYLDFNYPFKLRKIYNPPYILYTIGNIELLNKKIVAVIGSREPTNYSSAITKKIVNKLLKKGYTIVSGLAVGIDSVSYVECTKKGMENTIGVLGTGLHKEVFYPRLNYYLYTDMLEKNNLVISELLPKMKGNRYSFPLRNRIIAGLAESIIAIQAKLNSGSIITCNEALNQGKDVYIPLGPIDETMHKGTNLLIKEGAIPITDLDDIDDYF